MPKEIKKVIKKTKPAPIEAVLKEGKEKLSAPFFDAKGESLNSLALNEAIFGQKVNKKLLAQFVRVYLANQAVPSAHTLTRGEVAGGGKKPWRQKGTGRARAGSIRAPHWRGGGVVHGPRQVKVDLVMNQKMRRLALKEALASKLNEKQLLVIEKFNLKEPKTKEVSLYLKKLPLGKRNVLVIDSPEENILKATRNLKAISVESSLNLNAYQVLASDRVIFFKEALEALEKRLGN